ncbi:MAG: TadE/TadG family type IV pilus assembly protein [Isosphaeraceae bacterium]
MLLRRRPRRTASASVEFAVCLPFLCTILLGIWDLGRLIEVNQLLSNAAREGCRQASTAQDSASDVQAAVQNYLNRAGVNTTGMTVTVANLTSAGNSDPRNANQLDLLSVTVTLPANNVRFILAGNLPGASALTASSVWMSMRDIPVGQLGGIPQG